MLLFCDLTFSSACGIILFASVVKLVDTVDSKSAAARLEGSNPFTRIISNAYVTILLQVFDISCIVWYNT